MNTERPTLFALPSNIVIAGGFYIRYALEDCGSVRTFGDEGEELRVIFGARIMPPFKPCDWSDVAPDVAARIAACL